MSKTQKDNPKVLLLTGRAAERLVEKYAPTSTDIKVLPVDVAAFITIELILENLRREELQKYDLVMVPGLVQGDLSVLKDIFGIPFVKGPRYASDIELTFAEVDLFKLSVTHEADKLLQHLKYHQAKQLLKKGFTKRIEKNLGEFNIGFSAKFPVGIHRPPLVMAEIVDAPKLTNEQLIERTLYYLNSGAEIIDIGAIANTPSPEKIVKIIDTLQPLKKNYKFALSIDSLNIEEIKAAITANIELVLSIDHSNIRFLIEELPKEVGVVIIPTNVKEGFLPKDSNERIISLITLRDQLFDAGITKIVVDPIIEMPIYPGFVNSLEYYIDYRKVDITTPLMACIGNVTEFIAADPIGINALFGCIAVEIGIQFLLLTDVSIKCRGGIKEAIKARDMAYVAKQKNTPPKGFGYNLLMAKSRVANDLEIVSNGKKEIIELPSFANDLAYSLEYQPDKKGSFSIWIDYHKQKIFTTHLEYNTNKPTLVMIASTARAIFEEMVKRNLISNLDHAYYIGRELERAEICLYLGKTYVQNEQVFRDQEM